MPVTNPQEIRLNRQDDIEAIIGNPPGWTLRWGMTVLFFCMALLLTISWFVSYPDIVEAPTVLTTENPPIRLMAGASAKIISLRTNNDEYVQQGELLGILENPANTNDVLELEALVNELNETDPSAYLSFDLPAGLQLGSLQRSYADFAQNFEELQYFLSQDINYQKISNLRKQIIEIERLEVSLLKQINIFEQELQLSKNSVERDSELLVQGASYILEFERTKSDYLIKKRQLENLRSGSAANQLEIRQMEAAILDLQQKQSDSQNEHIVTIKNDIQKMKGQVDEWKQKWLLIAPISGKVVLTNAWSEQQFLREGDEFLTVVPPTQSAGEVIAKAQLKGPASGKVDTGMMVQIRLSGFPYQEYGVLNGSLDRIASAPSVEGYEIAITLDSGLVTSYKKEVGFRQEMDGIARIITEERSLLLRILEKIRSAFEN
ncbi:MAG: HlyD family efflux transporter periplasmic adaptor subunit [Bacteroidota bacterium]